MKLKTKFYLALGVLAAISAAYYFAQRELAAAYLAVSGAIYKTLPWLPPIVDFATREMIAGSLIGVALFSLVIESPIVPLPLEPYVIYAFTKTGNAFGVIAVATAFVTLGALFSYLIGRIFGPRIVEYVTKKPFQYNIWFDRLSGPLAFITKLLPLPDFFPLIFGAYKTNWIVFTIATALGVAVKLYVVLLLYQQYAGVVAAWVGPVFALLPQF